MRRTLLIAALGAVVFALFMIGACAQEKKGETAKSSSGQESAPAQTATVTAGKVLVDDEILLGFVDEPNHHFGLARKYFMEKDYTQASAELIKCASFVKLEAVRTSGDDMRMLEDAVIQLAELADAIKGGTIQSVEKLDAVYARVEFALAYHHQLKAQEFWSAENRKSAGQELRAASMHLENAMKYAGGETETETKAVIKDADDLGQRLIEGTAQAADKTGKAMQDLGAKIEEWGKKTMAPKK